MRSTAISSVSQFRSNVQWFLEGNTPNHQNEALADLAFSLRALSLLLKNQSQITKASVPEAISGYEDITRRDLQDIAKLKDVVANLTILANKEMSIIGDTKEFREAIIHLIIVAESHPDLQFRRGVLNLARMLS